MGTILIHDLIPHCDSLGPGTRFVVSVQGCSLRCPGCLVPETHDQESGREVPVAELVEQILATKDITGITLIGGEPMEQARSLVELVQTIKHYSALSVFTYTGYTLKNLLWKQNGWQLRLIYASDMLCDGPYLREAANTDLLWRGSANQKLYVFSKACRQQIENLGEQVKMEIEVNEAKLRVMGIPIKEALEIVKIMQK